MKKTKQIIKKVFKIIKKIFKIIKLPVMRVLPGQIAFFLVLSIFPLLTLIGVIASFFSISMTFVINLINSTFPVEVTNIILPFIQGKGFDTNIFIFMVIGFYLASNGTHSIILASNMLYNVDDNEFLKKRVRSFFMILLLLLLFIFLLAFLTFGNSIFKIILSITLKEYSMKIYNFFKLFKWPLSMFIVYFSVKLIYTIAPDLRIKSKTTTNGAWFTTIGWTISTAIYAYYVSNFTNYNIFYGSLSNVAILMIWIYILSYIFVIGIGINVNNYEYEKE